MRMDTMHSPSCAKVSIASNDRLTARLDSLIKPMMLAARRLNLCASMPPGSIENRIRQGIAGPMKQAHEVVNVLRAEFHRGGAVILAVDTEVFTLDIDPSRTELRRELREI